MKRGNKSSNKGIIEEHVAAQQELGSNYIGHITPTSGSAQDIVSKVINFLNSDIIETTI